MRSLKFVVVGLLLVGSLGFLIAMKFIDNMAYEISVAQYHQKKAEYADRGLRIAGVLTAGTHEIEQMDQGARHTFTMHDKENEDLSLDVVFVGPVPDTMRETFELTVEGKVGDDGVFTATHITPKCSSKYDTTYGGEAPTT